MDIRSYYLKNFRTDVEKIRFQLGSEVTNPNDFFFDKDEWKRVVCLIEDNDKKACFIFSMFITVASDQTMYAYYQNFYDDFRRLTRYPKFGWCGLGPHNENPLKLLQYAIADNAVDSNSIDSMSKEAAKLFVDEIFDFFGNHICEVSSKEFIDNFLDDEDVANVSSQSDVARVFVDDIREVLTKYST